MTMEITNNKKPTTDEKIVETKSCYFVPYYENVVVESFPYDLDVICSVFAGPMLLMRLHFIAKHCPCVRIEALTMAIEICKQTSNTTAYNLLHADLAHYVEQEGLNLSEVQIPQYDKAWVEITSKKSVIKFERLETDLRNYKSNSFKDCVRRGHDDLGEYYIDCGEYSSAVKCFMRSRDYCATNKQIITMCVNVAKSSIYLQNWHNVLIYGTKAETCFTEVDKVKDNIMDLTVKLRCCTGVAELCSGKFKLAAKQFIQISFDHMNFPEIMSQSLVAVYGGICALATFDRQELQALSVNTQFKQFLELEPDIRESIAYFLNSKYAELFDSLTRIKDALLLDIFLSPHVEALYKMIRNRALIQYFIPYKSACLRKMACLFKTSVAQIEEEVVKLIADEHVNARLDSQTKIVHAKDVDFRRQTFQRVMEIGNRIGRQTNALLLQAAIRKHNIIVHDEECKPCDALPHLFQSYSS